MVRRSTPLCDDPIRRLVPSASEPHTRCAWRIMVPAPRADRIQGCLAARPRPKANVHESSAPETPAVTETHPTKETLDTKSPIQGGHAAMTRAKKSKVASATSPSIAMDYC